MNLRQKLLLLVTLAATVTLVLGPAGASAAESSDGGSHSAASIPDFSGIWSHPYLTGFEIPLSGPGPVLNTQRTRNGVANSQMLVGDLQESDLAALGGRSGEKARRNLLGWRRISHAEQSVLAWRCALPVLGFPDADVAAAGPHHDALPPRQ
jgi:hypothetical protein